MTNSNQSNHNNTTSYCRSLSTPEGFLSRLPNSYVARPLRSQSRRSMSINQSDTQGPSNSQSVSSGLGLVPRLVDHQSLRNSWNSVVQETISAMSRVRHSDPAHPIMPSWLHSRSHRPSLPTSSTSGMPGDEHSTSPPFAPPLPTSVSNPVTPTTPVCTGDVVLNMQYIDQSSADEEKKPRLSLILPMSNSGLASTTSPEGTTRALNSPTPGSSDTPPLAGSSPTDPNIPNSPTEEEGGAVEGGGSGEGGDAANSQEDSAAEMMRQNPEATAVVVAFLKYVPFVIILLAKAFYDHIYGIFLFVALFATFRFYNVLVKRSASQADNQTRLPLIFGLAHLLMTISVFYLIYNQDELYLCLIFIPPNHTLITNLVHLLWIVIISDFIIKLSTIIIKIMLILLPTIILPVTKRGKWFLFIELTSQFYRSLVPIQFWLIYLMESYQGHQKVVGVFLSAAYIVAKGSNIMEVAKAWWKSFTKLLDNIQLGVSPTKETLLGVGCICPICHDEFKTPVQLTCCHIFCESCVTKWFDREQTCPLCRAKLVDDPSWRDGSTTYFIQMF